MAWRSDSPWVEVGQQGAHRPVQSCRLPSGTVQVVAVHASPDPSPGQQALEGYVVVVLPVVVVGIGRAAKLGAQDHERLVQRPLGPEVGRALIAWSRTDG